MLGPEKEVRDTEQNSINGGLHDWYSLPNIIKMVEDGMGATYGTTGREEHAYVLVENLKETDHFEDMGVDG